MIISVASTRNGFGQSITAINLTAAISSLFSRSKENRALIIDANHNSNDIEYYLSDGILTKGIDDFYNLYRCNLLHTDRFLNCVKNVHKNIDIMASNSNKEFVPQYADILMEYVEKLYNFTIIDTISLTDELSNAFFKLSDYIVVVLSQTKKSIKQFIQTYGYLKILGKKLVIIINRYLSKMDGFSIEYNLASITKELSSSGFECPVFCLPLNLELINECNAHTLLNLVLNTQNRNNSYVKHLNEVGRYLINNSKVFGLGKKENQIRLDIFKGLEVIKYNSI